MKKLIFITLLVLYSLIINAQTKHILYREDTIGNSNGIGKIRTNSFINNQTPYLYKTVWVDSSKIRNYFDTLLIASPGTNKIIVIDGMTIKHNSLLNYNNMACFMLYADTVLAVYTPESTPYNIYERLLFWETKLQPQNPFAYEQNSYIKVMPFSTNTVCIECADPESWVNLTDPQPWQISRCNYPNKGIRFLSGDFYYALGTHNTTGRRKFYFTIKYHIESILNY